MLNILHLTQMELEGTSRHQTNLNHITKEMFRLKCRLLSMEEEEETMDSMKDEVVLSKDWGKILN